MNGYLEQYGYLYDDPNVPSHYKLEKDGIKYIHEDYFSTLCSCSNRELPHPERSPDFCELCPLQKAAGDPLSPHKEHRKESARKIQAMERELNESLILQGLGEIQLSSFEEALKKVIKAERSYIPICAYRKGEEINKDMNEQEKA